MSQKIDRHLDWIYIGLLCLLALGLRFYRLDFQSLWIDELFDWRLTQISIPEMISNARITAQIPSYYIFFRSFIHFFGDTEFSLRFISATVSTLSVCLIYIFSSKFLSRTAGLFSATLLATSTEVIWHAQEFRPYSLLFFFSLLGNFLFFRLYFQTTKKELVRSDLYPYILICFILSQLHHFGFFQVLIMTCYLFVYKRSLIFTCFFNFSFFIIVILYLPWGIELLKHIFFYENQYHNSIGMSFLQHVEHYFLYVFPAVTGTIYWLLIIPIVLLPGLVFIPKKSKDKIEIKKWQYLIIWSFCPLFLFYLIEGLLKGSSFPFRHLMFALPGLFILVGWGAEIVFRNFFFSRVIIIFLLYFTFHHHVMVKLFYWTHNRLPSREIIKDMHRESHQEGVKLIALEHWGDPKDYYLRNYPMGERVVFYQFDNLRYIHFVNKLKDIPFKYVYSHYWTVLEELLVQPEERVVIFINHKQSARLNEWIANQSEYKTIEVRDYLYSLYHLYFLERKFQKVEI